MLKNEQHHLYIEDKANEVTITEFNETKVYQVLEKINDLPQTCYAVLNHLYVNPAHEEEFERTFFKRDKHLERNEGFESLLFLKPQSLNSHYVIVTLWFDEASFKNWQNSEDYKHSHRNRGTKKGVDQSIVNRDLSFKISIELSK
ncbi:antibiotic biosynthesis monooxygenase [Staphylococcus equorum]|nr:antibiotic biosynthesis monooxygenase [Staphylococcus equorum]